MQPDWPGLMLVGAAMLRWRSRVTVKLMPAENSGVIVAPSARATDATDAQALSVDTVLSAVLARTCAAVASGRTPRLDCSEASEVTPVPPLAAGSGSVPRKKFFS